jgi:hypothetical protein
MTEPRNIHLLNRLLALECRSFSIYLTDASPWTPPAGSEADEVLANIVADQQRMAARIAEFVDRRGGVLDTGEFPMEFTDSHFLAFDFLVGELLRYQKQEIADIEQIVAALAEDPEARELAEETLGSERAHLEALESLAGILQAAT